MPWYDEIDTAAQFSLFNRYLDDNVGATAQRTVSFWMMFAKVDGDARCKIPDDIGLQTTNPRMAPSPPLAKRVELLMSFFGGKNQLAGRSMEADAVADVLISQRQGRDQKEFERLAMWAKKAGINVNGAFENGVRPVHEASTSTIQKWFDDWEKVVAEDLVENGEAKDLASIRKGQARKLKGLLAANEGNFLLFTRMYDGEPLLLVDGREIKSKSVLKAAPRVGTQCMRLRGQYKLAGKNVELTITGVDSEAGVQFMRQKAKKNATDVFFHKAFKGMQLPYILNVKMAAGFGVG